MGEKVKSKKDIQERIKELECKQFSSTTDGQIMALRWAIDEI